MRVHNKVDSGLAAIALFLLCAVVAKASEGVLLSPLNVDLFADIPQEIRVDLDQDSKADLVVSMVVDMANTPFSGLQKTTQLRVVGLSGVSIGVGGPLDPGEQISRGDRFFRTETLTRYQGTEKTEHFFGNWARSEEQVRGLLPLRMIKNNAVYLGYLDISVDGYGNASLLATAMSAAPVNEMKLPDTKTASAEIRGTMGTGSVRSDLDKDLDPLAGIKPDAVQLAVN